jgi:multidrug transporter EmrE-like cation transporter
VLYAIAGLPAWYSYKLVPWMEMGIIWQALSVTLTIIIGVIVFGEVLSWSKLLAFSLILIAAWLGGKG